MSLFIISEKISFSIICSKFSNGDEKIFKEEEPIEPLKILHLIINTGKYQNNI